MLRGILATIVGISDFNITRHGAAWRRPGGLQQHGPLGADRGSFEPLGVDIEIQLFIAAEVWGFCAAIQTCAAELLCIGIEIQVVRVGTGILIRAVAAVELVRDAVLVVVRVFGTVFVFERTLGRVRFLSVQ